MRLNMPDSQVCKEPLRIGVVGDLMLGDSSICVGFGYHSAWSEAMCTKPMAAARSMLEGCDIVIGNLETVLCNTGEGTSRWKSEQLRASGAAASKLSDFGFSVLGVANNHALQHGPDGFFSTVTSLESSGIVVAGIRGELPWVCRPAIIDKRGMRIGVLAYCWRPRQYHSDIALFAEGDVESVCADTTRLREICDVVVVSLHWGEEFVGTPSALMVEQAKSIVHAGASIIMGHHPHAVGPVSSDGTAVVAYSMGNFVSDMVWTDETREAGVLVCVADGRTVTVADSAIFWADHQYVLRHLGKSMELLDDASVPNSEYSNRVTESVSRHRLASYRYALVNCFRFPASVLIELTARTLMNKFSAFGESVRVRLSKPR